MSDTIIIAPHMDDEIIGCYSVLKTKNPIIVYTEEATKERQEEALTLREHVQVKAQMFFKSIPNQLLNFDNTFYFPHPTYEYHPAHRIQGSIGEQLARKGHNVIFYVTNMTAPFIKEEYDPAGKEELLNKIYPSQKSLWEYEKKYILFSGYSQWIFK